VFLAGLAGDLGHDHPLTHASRGQAHLMLWIRDFKFLRGDPDRRAGIGRLNGAELDPRGSL